MQTFKPIRLSTPVGVCVICIICVYDRKESAFSKLQPNGMYGGKPIEEVRGYHLARHLFQQVHNKVARHFAHHIPRNVHRRDLMEAYKHCTDRTERACMVARYVRFCVRIWCAKMVFVIFL